MADSRRLVEGVIERDPVIKKGLQRGIINSRALVRFIQKVDGVDVSSDAILGIIRRYPLVEEEETRHRLVLKDCEITMRTRVGDLAIEKGPDTMKRISEFASSMRSTRGENLRVLAGLRYIRVIADQKSLERFRQEFSEKDVIKFSEDLVEVSLLLTPEAERTEGIFARITSELALRGVNPIGIWCCAPEAIFIIKEEDSPRAIETLQKMLS